MVCYVVQEVYHILASFFIKMDTGPKTRPYISVSMGVIALLRFIEDKCYKCWVVCNNEDMLLLAITHSIFIYMLKVNPLNVKNRQNFFLCAKQKQ